MIPDKNIHFSIENYLYPSSKNLKTKFQWLRGRIWNAIKHTIGKSDWDIQKKKIATQERQTHDYSKLTSFARAELILQIELNHLKLNSSDSEEALQVDLSLLDEIHVDSYVYFPEDNLKSKFRSIGFRIWNSVKHLFGCSSWDIKRKALTKKLNSSSNRIKWAQAEFLLRLKIDQLRAKHLTKASETSAKEPDLWLVPVDPPSDQNQEFPSLPPPLPPPLNFGSKGKPKLPPLPPPQEYFSEEPPPEEKEELFLPNDEPAKLEKRVSFSDQQAEEIEVFSDEETQFLSEDDSVIEQNTAKLPLDEIGQALEDVEERIIQLESTHRKKILSKGNSEEQDNSENPPLQNQLIKSPPQKLNPPIKPKTYEADLELEPETNAATKPKQTEKDKSWNRELDTTPFDESHIKIATSLLQEVKTDLEEKMNHCLAEKLHHQPFKKEATKFTPNRLENQKILNALVSLLKKEGFDSVAFKLAHGARFISEFSFGFKNKEQDKTILGVVEQKYPAIIHHLKQLEISNHSEKVFIPYIIYVDTNMITYELSANDKKKLALATVNYLKSKGSATAKFNEPHFSITLSPEEGKKLGNTPI